MDAEVCIRPYYAEDRTSILRHQLESDFIEEGFTSITAAYPSRMAMPDEPPAAVVPRQSPLGSCSSMMACCGVPKNRLAHTGFK